MRLRSTITPFIPYNENYCHILNITNAILGVTTQVVHYKKIPCENQPKNIFCDNINKLFSNVIILNPPYIKVVDVLNKSLSNTLDCNNTVTNNTYHYELIPIMILALVIVRLLSRRNSNHVKIL